ncbi:MAG: MFS transporter [Dehalococcoidia bacterium]|nr:MFS transporter [Dehalococcoidia bacterium]
MLLSKFKDRIFYGWVVVATFFIAGTAIWGIRFSFGVFFKSLESEFALSRATTSAIFSAQMVLGGIFTILGGWALDRFGPRIVILLMGICTGLSLLLAGQTSALWQIFLAYSLLMAMGTGAIFVVVMSTVSRWFERRRGLALGLASLGAGMGPLMVAPFATYLLSISDWRMAFTILGAIAWVVVIPLSRLLKRDPQEIGMLPDGAEFSASTFLEQKPVVSADHLSPRQAFRTRSFWLFIGIFFLFSSSLFLVLTHLVPHITDLGFSAVEAATVLSVAGGATIVGRVLFGMASDRMGRKRAVMVGTLLHVTAMVWLLWSRELWMFYLWALVFGFAWGGTGPTMAALIGDTFGLGRIGAILGLLEVGFGTGAGLGPVIGGAIFDLKQSYFLAFLLGVAAMLVTTVLVSFIRRERGRTVASR